MNYQMIGFVIGRILLTEAALLALPLVTALLYGEPAGPFLIPALVLVLVGLVLSGRKPQRTALYARDGLAVVALAWIAICHLRGYPQFCGRLF